MPSFARLGVLDNSRAAVGAFLLGGEQVAKPTPGR